MPTARRLRKPTLLHRLHQYKLLEKIGLELRKPAI